MSADRHSTFAWGWKRSYSDSFQPHCFRTGENRNERHADCHDTPRLSLNAQFVNRYRREYATRCQFGSGESSIGSNSRSGWT